jgi:acetoacetyl-CoA synthetase
MSEPLWTPPADRVAASDLARFAHAVDRPLDYPTLHRWSVEEPEDFWSAVWAHLLPAVPRSGPALVGGGMLDTTWFPDERLNVAERILAGDADPDRVPGPDDVMLVAVDERGRRRELTRASAVASAASVAAALRAAGVGPGDRVAAWLPNTLESMVLMLGAASIGAVFSSCSPDFGADGVLDRFGQIEPAVLVAADGYTYGGRSHDRREELARIVRGLPSLGLVVVLPFLREPQELVPVGEVAGTSTVLWQDWLDPHAGAAPSYEQLGFDHPWYVLFSSGTTGVPKCIVHRTGGVLLQHLKEHRLHLDIGPGDRVAYFTTCGWMMWNWLASVPASGATAVLYEGNPFHPGPERLWSLVEQEALTFLGVSAKYLEAVEQAGIRPAEVADLSTLRTLASTGSPLSPESYEWVMSAVAPGASAAGLHLASISGGTDLCGCFVGGEPTGPVYAGEIQRPALGMAVDVWSDDGGSMPAGERGELVCTAPFPSMPLGFWGDGPLGEVGPRYRAAYFERIPGVWAQGDFATWTEHGGMVIHGRSDTTLNPGGVRIGTAEIYRQVDRVPQVLESLVFGQQVDNDVRIVLLVRLAEGVQLDDELVAGIRARVREGCTPRHVPALVVAVDDLPRTRSGKLAELAVADRVNGREVRNTTALANPEALDAIAAAVSGEE